MLRRARSVAWPLRGDPSPLGSFPPSTVPRSPRDPSPVLHRTLEEVLASPYSEARAARRGIEELRILSDLQIPHVQPSATAPPRRPLPPLIRGSHKPSSPGR